MTHKNAKPQMSNYCDCTISDTFWQNLPLSGCSIFHGILRSTDESELNPPSVSFFFPLESPPEDLKPVKSKTSIFKTKILNQENRAQVSCLWG